MKNKRGGMTDLFLFMIISVVIIFVSAIMIYIGLTANTKLHEELDGKMFGSTNGTELVTDTIGKVNNSYGALYWISVFLIVGMALSIFIGSYLVTTRPVFFIPYIFILIIAIIVAVGISNAYEQVIADPTLADTFNNFVGANYIMSMLPLWVAVIGIIGGIIMFTRMGSDQYQGSVYG